MPNNRHGKPQKPASQKDEDAVAFAQGIFELARNGGAGPLSVMLSAGVPANMRNSDGETLLMLASRNGHTDTVRLLLEGTAQGLVDPKGEIGCMLNTGMIASHPDHADLAHELAQRRRAFRELLAAKLCQWVGPVRAQRLSRYIVAVMQGLAIQARDGYSLEELREVVSEALDAIPVSP